MTYWVPPELLQRIFQYVPGSILDEHKKNYGQLGVSFRNHRIVMTRDVIPLMHVCQRWRKIVMNMPDLWRTIDSRMRIPYEYYASRSRGLSLGAYFYDEPRVDLVEWLQGHAAALHELHCFASSDDDWGPLLRIFFPELRVATLWFTHTKNEGEVTFELSSSLHQLCLEHTNWLPKGHFPHLTRLVLTHWTGTCEVAHLLSFLRECPYLVDIAFTHLFPRNTIPARQDDIVRLPHLQRLIIQYEEPGQIGHCLSHMHMQCSTALRVRMSRGLWEPGMDFRDVRGLSQFLAAKQCTRLHIFMITMCEGAVTALSGSSGVHIQGFGTSDRDSEEPMLAQLLPLSQVEELWLVENVFGYDVYDYIRRSGLFDILPHMQALRRVVVTAQVLRKLIESRASHDQLGVDGLWPPNLHELHVLLYPNAERLTQEELTESMTLLANSRVPRRSVMVPWHCAVLRNRVKDLHLDDKIECDVYQRIPSIALPPVCSIEEELWPAWQTYLDPPHSSLWPT